MRIKPQRKQRNGERSDGNPRKSACFSLKCDATNLVGTHFRLTNQAQRLKKCAFSLGVHPFFCFCCAFSSFTRMQVVNFRKSLDLACFQLMLEQKVPQPRRGPDHQLNNQISYTACAAFCLHFLHSSRHAYIHCFMDRALHKYSFGSFMLKEQRGRDWSMGQVGWVIPLGLFRLLEHLLKTELYFDSETKSLQLLGKPLF